MKAMYSSLAIRVLVLIVLTLTTTTANAYVGPGLGLGLIGVLFGGIAVILLAVGGIVWYPVKRLLKKSRASRNSVEKSNAKAPEKEKEDENEKSN